MASILSISARPKTANRVVAKLGWKRGFLKALNLYPTLVLTPRSLNEILELMNRLSDANLNICSAGPRYVSHSEDGVLERGVNGSFGEVCVRGELSTRGL